MTLKDIPVGDQLVGVGELRSQWRRQVLPTLFGEVLDVGAGDGGSAGYLPSSARVTFLEPHAGSVRRLRHRVDTRIGARVLRASAESIPLADASMDVALCCAVLCSVADQDRALEEICRVLRPGGRLVLLEHVAAGRGTWLRRGQQLVAPLSRRCDRGCDPARETGEALARSALRVVDMRRINALGLWGLQIPHLAAVLVRVPASDSAHSPGPPQKAVAIGHRKESV